MLVCQNWRERSTEALTIDGRSGKINIRLSSGNCSLNRVAADWVLGGNNPADLRSMVVHEEKKGR